MQSLIRIVIVVLFLAAIAAFTFSYTVRFTESAVTTTFGRAGDGAIQDEPGLKFKWPYPIQSVTKYDQRLRLLQAKSATQQTADDSQIVVEAFATWRVSDPLKFYQRFSNAGQRSADHFRQAQENLAARLTSAMGETSKFRLSELFTAEQNASQLPQLEDRMFAAISASTDGAPSLTEYGVEVTSVGINRIELPAETTTKVIERMGANRDRLAQELESQGTARATAIEAQAQADAEKIRRFADRRASEIRARGEREAAEFLAQMNENVELAVFLQNLELMREAMAKRFTFIMSEDDFGFSLFNPRAIAESEGLPSLGGDPVESEQASIEGGRP
ncbi:MAG: SPFH domain-containing protein [Planctomycetota bacterium]